MPSSTARHPKQNNRATNHNNRCATDNNANNNEDNRHNKPSSNDFHGKRNVASAVTSSSFCRRSCIAITVLAVCGTLILYGLGVTPSSITLDSLSVKTDIRAEEVPLHHQGDAPHRENKYAQSSRHTGNANAMSFGDRLQKAQGAIASELAKMQPPAPMTVEIRETKKTSNPSYYVPLPLRYGNDVLDHPHASWNHPICFAQRIKPESEPRSPVNAYDPRDDEEGASHMYVNLANDKDELDKDKEWSVGVKWLHTRGPPPEFGLNCSVPNSIYDELKQNYGEGDLNKLLDNEKSGLCILSLAFHNNCNPYRETVVGCVARQGHERLSVVVSKRCKNSNFWKNLATHPLVTATTADRARKGGRLAATAPAEFSSPEATSKYLINPRYWFSNSGDVTTAESTDTHNMTLLPTPVALSPTTRAQVCVDSSSVANANLVTSAQGSSSFSSSSPSVFESPDLPRYVPPSERNIAPFGDHRTCRNGAKQYPFSFSNVRRNFWPRMYPKLFDFNPVSPTGARLLESNDEELYDAMGALSYFSYTHARGGWECMRHHQQLAHGCVPYYPDLLAKPNRVQSNFPFELLKSVIQNPALSHIGYVNGADDDIFHGLRMKPRARDQIENNISDHQVKERELRFSEDTINGQRASVHPRQLPMESAYLRVGASVYWPHRSMVFFQQPRGTIQHDLFDPKWYWRTARALKRYAYMNMTGESTAAYILKTMNAEDARSILIIGNNNNDYTEISLELGLSALGINLTITGDPTNADRECLLLGKHIGSIDTDSIANYRDVNATRARTTHGFGWMSFFRRPSGRTTWYPHLDKVPVDQQFDAVIFAHFERGGIPDHLVDKYKRMTNGRVAAFQHDDTNEDPYGSASSYSKKVVFFSRELRRESC